MALVPGIPLLLLLLLLHSPGQADQKASGQSKSQQILVHYGNRTFDVTSFVPFHPGGPLVLQHVNGKDVSEYLAGHKSVTLPEMGGMVLQHRHGPGAFHVLNSLEMKEKKAGKSKRG